MNSDAHDHMPGPLDTPVESTHSPASGTGTQFTSFLEVLESVQAGLIALAQMARPFVAAIARYDQIATFYENSGWLPYRTVPFQEHFREHLADRSEAHSRICSYYQESVAEILLDIDVRIQNYDIDDEAAAVMREATKAHRAELYRCVCRVLLPEMERVIRTDLLHIEDLISINEKHIQAKLETLHLDDVVVDSPHDFILSRIFHKHLFAPVRTAESENVSVPNRHASTHGWIAYASMKESLNAIICADYVFRLVSSLKKPGPTGKSAR